LFDPAINLDEKCRLGGQNIMDFISFAADVKDNLEFRVFEVYFLGLAFVRQGG
jgi:hypothetical protein